MKKTSQIIKEKTSYDISELIGDIALICSCDNKYALLNIKTNELVIEFDNYVVSCDTLYKFYKLTDCNDQILIYDALNNKVIAKNYKFVEHISNGTIIYKSNTTGKYHLYVSTSFRGKGDIFDIGFDEIKSINEYIFILTKDGKKALFDSSKEEQPNFIYDDIKYEDKNSSNAIILEKNNKKYLRFIDYCYLTEEEWGPFEDAIIKDKMTHCKKGKTIEIYKDSVLVLSFDNVDNINLLVENSEYFGNVKSYLFEAENNGKKTIVASHRINNNEHKTSIVNGTKGADEITVSKNKYKNIYLRFGKKYKMLIQGLNYERLVDNKYDKIEHLIDDFYMFTKGNKNDIFSNNSGIVVENITHIESITEAGIEFIKDNKRCLLAFHYHYGDINSLELYENYDEFEYLGDLAYRTKKNKKKGLIINAQIEFKPKYKEIKTKKIDYKEIDYKDQFILLEKFNGKYELERYLAMGEGYKNISKDLNSVEFFKDIIVIKNADSTIIMNYKEKVLKEFPKNTQVSEVIEKLDNKNKILYEINNDIYFYENDNFEKALMYEQDKYITDYEDDDNNIIRIETRNKELHDNLCTIIEGLDLQGQALVNKIYYDSADMRCNHKNVVKLITPKKNIEE